MKSCKSNDEHYFSEFDDVPSDFSGVFRLQVGNGSVAMKLRRSDSPVLIIFFHGAIDRSKRQVPIFTSFERAPVTANYLSISDPSLERDSTLRIGWHIGNKDQNLQELLPKVFDSIVARLGIEKVIFVGSSGGGFAALYYSYKMANSIAVVCNPQTNIEKYYRNFLTRYLDSCWDKDFELSKHSEVITLNLTGLYSKGLTNRVIYLQNSTDTHHMTNHFAPFASVIPGSDEVKFISKVDFWGSTGHSAIPSSEWFVWVKAALESDAHSAVAILERYRLLSNPQPAKIDNERIESKGKRKDANDATSSPYENLPESAFWKPSVAERHFYELKDLAKPIEINVNDRIGTAGSCFAQHISRHLRNRGGQFLDCEPKPQTLHESEAQKYGFGLYSCRYGNVYTARQLLQLMQESLGERTPREIVWSKEGRFFDALRPSVDPFGLENEESVVADRIRHLEKVRELWSSLDLFVFTLGLTEAWVANEDGTVYPTAPGTICGTFDPAKYSFRNYNYSDVRDDLMSFFHRLREINPKARMLLTVSPVPLTATASGKHVLVATMQSKATLRAVAGDLSDEIDGISYFPSYEIIATHPSRGMFFNPDLRTVNSAGVEYVMKHLFCDNDTHSTRVTAISTLKEISIERAKDSTSLTSINGFELVCDEGELEKFVN